MSDSTASDNTASHSTASGSTASDNTASDSTVSDKTASHSTVPDITASDNTAYDGNTSDSTASDSTESVKAHTRQGIADFRNVDDSSPVDSAQHFITLECPATPLREPVICQSASIFVYHKSSFCDVRTVSV